jgi:hypothetical protein
MMSAGLAVGPVRMLESSFAFTRHLRGGFRRAGHCATLLSPAHLNLGSLVVLVAGTPTLSPAERVRYALPRSKGGADGPPGPAAEDMSGRAYRTPSARAMLERESKQGPDVRNGPSAELQHG